MRTKKYPGTQVYPLNAPKRTLVGRLAVRGNSVPKEQTKSTGEAFLYRFAEAISGQQWSFLSIRIAESESIVADPKKLTSARVRTPENVGDELNSMESFLAASVYKTTTIRLEELTPDTSFAAVQAALDLANEAWWRLQQARGSQRFPSPLSRTANRQ